MFISGRLKALISYFMLFENVSSQGFWFLSQNKKRCLSPFAHGKCLLSTINGKEKVFPRVSSFHPFSDALLWWLPKLIYFNQYSESVFIWSDRTLNELRQDVNFGCRATEQLFSTSFKWIYGGFFQFFPPNIERRASEPSSAIITNEQNGGTKPNKQNGERKANGKRTYKQITKTDMKKWWIKEKANGQIGEGGKFAERRQMERMKKEKRTYKQITKRNRKNW